MKKPVAIVFNIRSYRDRTFGNTYSKGEATLIYRDGSTCSHAMPFQYGSADMLARNARIELQQEKRLPKQEEFEFTREYFDRNKIAVVECFANVATKKEM